VSALRCLPFPAPDYAVGFNRRPDKRGPNQECRQGAAVADRFIRALPHHIEKSDCSRTAVQIWIALCGRRNGANETFATMPQLAAACMVSVRTAQRAVEELLQTGWLCKPNGDRGGRPRESNINSKPASTFHLHPFTKGCGAVPVESIQRRPRPDMVEVNRRRWRIDRLTHETEKDDRLSWFLSSFGGDDVIAPSPTKDHEPDIDLGGVQS
jgi:hypothetical protein